MKGKGMFKVMMMVRKQPGVSREAFIDYFENFHIREGLPPVKHVLKRYVRHYVTPHAAAIYGADEEAPCDLISELEFESEADIWELRRLMADPKMTAMLSAQDEKYVNYGETMRVMVVEDYETKF